MSTATPFSHRAAEYIGYQLALRPRLRRVATLWLTTHTLGACAVIAAPPAAASTLAGALNWTGITDSHHVPIGNYYLSVVNTSEAITKAGPPISANPASWARWLANAVNVGLTHETVCQLLQWEAAIYIFLMAMALWLLKFAMSNTWLYWLATWVRPLFATLQKILADLWVFPACLVAGLAVGAFHIFWHGRKGHGTGIMLSSFAMGVVGMIFTGNPLADLYNENGLITQGRNLGFTMAQAAFHNGPLTTGGSTAQLQHLTGLIADATVRMPLQLMNFGAPIDNIGDCGQAYTAAMLNPRDPADAAHQMAHCGAPDALSFAQHLSGANLAVGLIYALLGAMFAAFVCYVTYSYVMVCSAAFINALLSVATAATAMIHGRPRRRAIRRFTLMFKHAGLVFAYTTYISVAAIILLKMASIGGYADQVGMTHPLARLLMIAITSVAAIGVFRWLKHELGDHTRQDLTNTVTDLQNKAREGYQRGQDGYQRARDLNSRAPWSKKPDTGDEPSSHPDEPLTGTPVQGRPPGGPPPNPGSGTTAPHTPSPTPPAPSGAAAAGADAGASAGATSASAAATGTAVTAGEAAGAVVAPEVAAAVIAARAATSHHSQRRAAQSSPNQAPAGNAGAPSHEDTAPVAGHGDGRTRRSPPPTAAPRPTDARTASGGGPHLDAQSAVDDQPVKGR
ncbi:hypothetical protein [Mycobacterium kyorinense]|uniref:Uncharacterized protein n=1 Tax=Mycobacterium kyorinense TaxID=487514 RepID=A0A1X1YHJ3_9MYCO|nr:hypothetical protein [Mycobacterium kyorinense]ORW10582.1 hypothetical protein AWC14_20010 [Mycobacterium kyorinense]